jgi:hypothetical protein
VNPSNSSLNGCSSPNTHVNVSEASSNSTSTSSSIYLRFLSFSRIYSYALLSGYFLLSIYLQAITIGGCLFLLLSPLICLINKKVRQRQQSSKTNASEHSARPCSKEKLAMHSSNKAVQAQSLPFAFPASYIILSAYMLCASFVSFLQVISGFITKVPSSSPWSEQFLSPTDPQAPPETFHDFDEPQQFLPKRSKLAPGRRLLRLGLMAAISMADSIPDIDLLQDKSLKRDL